jgi:uncharacterized protein (DUF2267 family)
MTQPVDITISKESVFLAQMENAPNEEEPFVHTIELTKDVAKPVFEALKNTLCKDEIARIQNELIDQMAAQLSMKVLPKNISGKWLATYVRSFKRA